VTRIKEVLGTISTYGQRLIDIDNFKDGIKIRCNGGHDVAAMISNKLIKAGLKTNLPNNSRFITVYFKIDWLGVSKYIVGFAYSQWQI